MTFLRSSLVSSAALCVSVVSLEAKRAVSAARGPRSLPFVSGASVLLFASFNERCLDVDRRAPCDTVEPIKAI